MVYIITLVTVLLLALHFDIGGSKRYYYSFYYGILVWLIFLSGFQYMVGTDIPYYMEEYENLSLNDFSWDNLKYLSSERRQFGWMIFLYCCRFFTGNFFLPKLLQAIFLNIAIFTFFKKISKYTFFCIFFYLLIGFLVLNYNVLRQSIALALELYAILYFKDRKYWKFTLFVFLAFQFHNSALILCLIPFIRIVSLYKNQVAVLIATSIMFVFIMLSINIVDVFFSLTQTGLIGDNLANVGVSYMQSARQGVREEFSIFSIKNIVNLSIIIWYFYQNKDEKGSYNIIWGYFGLIAFLIDLFSAIIPVVWRFRIYFEFGYYIVFSSFVCTFFKDKYFYRIKPIVICASILLVSIYPLRYYLVKYEGSNYRYIDQYYPYHTVFNPERDFKKEFFFNNL